MPRREAALRRGSRVGAGCDPDPQDLLPDIERTFEAGVADTPFVERNSVERAMSEAVTGRDHGESESRTRSPPLARWLSALLFARGRGVDGREPFADPHTQGLLALDRQVRGRMLHRPENTPAPRGTHA